MSYLSRSDTNLGNFTLNLATSFLKTFANDMQAAASAVVGQLFAETEATGKRL